MRVVVLPVCQLDSYSHVLLKYDFRVASSSGITTNNHSQEFYLTPYCSPILPSGSIQTVCEVIKDSTILRHLFNLNKDNEENLENKVKRKRFCF
jgi:hypothetical protein